MAKKTEVEYIPKPERFKPSIGSYLLAGFPCLYCDTVEEMRAVDAIKKFAREVHDEAEEGNAPYRVAVWRSTTGLVLDGEKEAGDATLKDLTKALPYVAAEPRNSPMIGIFLNLRQLIGNFMVIQTLKDAIYKARLNGNHIIIVGPGLDLPPELYSVVTYADFPLPTREGIKKTFQDMIEAFEGTLDLPEGEEKRQKLLGKAAESALGMTELEAENAIALSLAELNRVDIELIQGEKEQAIKKSEVLEFISPSSGMDDVGDFDLLKEWMDKRSTIFTDAARAYGLPYPKGILLIGPPGTGKSLTAKAASKYLQLPLIKFDIGKLFKKFVGESEGASRSAIKTIEAAAPVVVWFDEMEKGFAGVSSSGSTDSGVTARVLGTILTWMQERTCMAFCIATVNNVQSLPPEVYRAGRFDGVFAIDLPQLDGRVEIFSIHIRKRGRDPKKFNLQSIAAKAVGFVGAEIEHIVEEAMFTAFADGGREFTTQDILNEISIAYPQSVMDQEKIAKIREFCRKRARPVSSTSPAFTEKQQKREPPHKPSRPTRGKQH